MDKLKGRMLIAQGGGPTAVINYSLAGAVLKAREFGCIKKIYGSRNGVRGIINQDLVDLTDITEDELFEVADSPAAALFSTRDKPDSEYCIKIFDVLKKHDIRYFFYIGGNDSSDTLRLVKEFSDHEGYDINTVHIPKTIDNDLVLNDHTPGFPSAAKFVAESFVGLDLDNRALPGVYIAVIMGRNAGFLTAASSMGRDTEDSGPHLIYVPERPFIIDNFLKDVKEVYNKYGRCMVAVSEGIQDSDGIAIAAKMTQNIEKDAHGNIQLSGSGSLGDALKDYIKKNTDISRVRADTFGYLQRSFRALASEVDKTEAKEVGAYAVECGAGRGLSGSVTIKRIEDYKVEYKLVGLEEVAAKTRIMPDNFINADHNNVTEEFRTYLKPLLGKDFKGPGKLLKASRVEPI